MTNDLGVSCECGKLKAIAHAVSPGTVNRLICGCKFCQRFTRHFNRDQELLDEFGGTDLFQMSPKSFEFTSGTEHLKSLKLTSKGALRWYADCCNTPLANTAPSPNIAFVGVLTKNLQHANPKINLDQTLGPTRARISSKTGAPLTGKVKQIPMYLNIIAKLIKWRLRGDQKKSPFFNHSTGEPVVVPEYIPYKK